MSNSITVKKDEVHSIIKSNILPKVKKLEIDTILAVCPGGLAPATILFDLLISEEKDSTASDIGFETAEMLYNSGINKFLPIINKISCTQFCNVLIVDSVINTGNTINVVSSFINANKIYVCTLFNNSGIYFPYYIYGKILEKDVNILIEN
jgi:hypoxanthine phosphoribosyltransferase